MRSIPLDLKHSSSSQPPFSAFQTFHEANVSNENEASPSPPSSSSSSLIGISPLILLVITVLSVIFFIYGLIHLVLWFLMKRPSSSSSILYNSNRFQESTTRTRALQRQLQNLFRLHDSGLDQALIDSLPLFHYQDLLDLKEPFDCAVCLFEFSEHDKLRLLPMCSHAFHMDCLDTWLLSNSTCPLCRATVEKSPTLNYDNNSNSLVVSNKEENGNGCSESEEKQKIMKRVLSVRLGKFRNIGLEGGEGIESGGCSLELDERRCYSMGSYQYVVGDMNLQVVLSQSGEEGENENVEGKRIRSTTKGESFSVSKIWLWSKTSKFHSSNAAFP